MATTGSGRWAAVMAAVLLASTGGAAAADVPDAGQGGDNAPQPFLGGFLAETRIVYPLRVGDWEAVGEKLYDVAELGASVRYRSGDSLDRWIDIYFYPVGVVPDSHLDEAARATLQEIGSGVGVPGGYTSAEFGALRNFHVVTGDGDDEKPLSARSADMRLLREGGAWHSAMTLLVDRMYYVKGRYSVAATAMRRGKVRSELEGFVAQLVRGTYIGSTGRCWSPARIEALPAGAAAPANSRLAMESDAGDSAYLVADRVLARDPSSATAQALALLAMSLDNRLHPGCVGAEPHNPEVPEGHREIRFEYRAPAAVPGDRGGRLAPSRDGLG